MLTFSDKNMEFHCLLAYDDLLNIYISFSRSQKQETANSSVCVMCLDEVCVRFLCEK